MSAIAELKEFMAKADEISKNNPTKEQLDELRSKAPAIIEKACREQYKDSGGVLTPPYCAVCKSCVIGQLIMML